MPHRFVAGWAGEGWPADVDRVLALAPEAEVVVARRLSEGARARLAERQVGWVDETGQANVNLRSGLVVVRASTSEPPVSSPSERWNLSTLAAAEAILAGIPPTVEAIEVATGLSRGSTANALARLERRGHLGRPGAKRGQRSARQLLDVDGLVEDYVATAGAFRGKGRVRRLHRPMADPLHVLEAELGPALCSLGATWALTGAGARAARSYGRGHIDLATGEELRRRQPVPAPSRRGPGIGR